jgi:hypothetical protein
MEKSDKTDNITATRAPTQRIRMIKLIGNIKVRYGK